MYVAYESVRDLRRRFLSLRGERRVRKCLRGSARERSGAATSKSVASQRAKRTRRTTTTHRTLCVLALLGVLLFAFASHLVSLGVGASLSAVRLPFFAVFVFARHRVSHERARTFSTLARCTTQQLHKSKTQCQDAAKQHPAPRPRRPAAPRRQPRATRAGERSPSQRRRCLRCCSTIRPLTLTLATRCLLAARCAQLARRLAIPGRSCAPPLAPGPLCGSRWRRRAGLHGRRARVPRRRDPRVGRQRVARQQEAPHRAAPHSVGW